MVSRTEKNVLNVSLMLSTHCINEYTDVVYSINRFTYIMTYEHLLLNTVYYMISYPCLSIQTYLIMFLNIEDFNICVMVADYE